MSSGDDYVGSGVRQGGFTYVSMLFAVAIIGAGLAAVGEVWSQVRQREREQELIWVGRQFRDAIALYYLRTPGAVKRYPERLEDLLEDRRYVTTQRYLRRIHVDPVTGTAQWGIVSAPQGGIMGVYSLSERTPQKKSGFPPVEAAFEGAGRYMDWRFVYIPPTTASPPAQATPARTGS